MVTKTQFLGSLAVVSLIVSGIGDVGIINSGIDSVSFENLGPYNH